MQAVIEKESAQQTIIAVVHRFRYIDRFDRVVLLKHGHLVECDSPKVLLERDSEFRKLYTALKRPGWRIKRLVCRNLRLILIYVLRK